MNFEKIERGGHVLLHVPGLAARPSVASAIGVGDRRPGCARGHALQPGINRRITLVVDEVANVINQPLIEI